MPFEGCFMWAWTSFFAACAAHANFLAAHFKIMYIEQKRWHQGKKQHNKWGFAYHYSTFHFNQLSWFIVNKITVNGSARNTSIKLVSLQWLQRACRHVLAWRICPNILPSTNGNQPQKPSVTFRENSQWSAHSGFSSCPEKPQQPSNGNFLQNSTNVSWSN